MQSNVPQLEEAVQADFSPPSTFHHLDQSDWRWMRESQSNISFPNQGSIFILDWVRWIARLTIHQTVSLPSGGDGLPGYYPLQDHSLSRTFHFRTSQKYTRFILSCWSISCTAVPGGAPLLVMISRQNWETLIFADKSFQAGNILDHKSEEIHFSVITLSVRMRSLVSSIQVTRGSSQQEEESGSAQSEDYQKIIVEVSWDRGGRREERRGSIDQDWPQSG